MIDFIKRMLSCPFAMFGILALVSALALGMALMSQYMFGLAPCNLCIIQRYPYGVVIAISIIGFFIAKKHRSLAAALMGVIGVAFLFNSAAAFYHTGVELKWWKSFLEGCKVPEFTGTPEETMAKIQAATEVVPCDEIPWADPILGLSMANYNVIFCLGLAVVAFISAYFIEKNKNLSPYHKNK